VSQNVKLLKFKLLGAFIFFSFIPMLFIAIHSYNNIKNEITSSTLLHLEAIAKIKSLQIERFYARVNGSINSVQNSPYIKNILSNRLNDNSVVFNEAKNTLEQHLHQYISKNNIDEIYILKPDGKLVVGSNKTEDDKVALFNKVAIEKGKKKIYFSDLYRGHEQNKSYLFTVSAPITDNNNTLVGIVIAEFVADDFFNQIQDYSGLGQSGETLLGKKINNKIMFLNPLRHDSDAAMHRSAEIGGRLAIPVLSAASGQTGSGISTDYRGVEVLAAWRYIPTTGWGMVAKIDTSEALEPLEVIRNSIAVTSLLLLIFALIFSLQIATKLVQPVERLERTAHLDTLTGIPNRKLFIGLLEQALSKARLNGMTVAVMFLDLDGFKNVNDAYGHEIGDLLLKKVALRLSKCIRQSDTVARFGGDEFVILLCGVKGKDNIARIANTIVETLCREFSINDTAINIGVSIGISVFGQNADSADEMLKCADGAMYEVKKTGKNNFKFANTPCNE